MRITLFFLLLVSTRLLSSQSYIDDFYNYKQIDSYIANYCNTILSTEYMKALFHDIPNAEVLQKNLEQHLTVEAVKEKLTAAIWRIPQWKRAELFRLVNLYKQSAAVAKLTLYATNQALGKSLPPILTITESWKKTFYDYLSATDLFAKMQRTFLGPLVIRNQIWEYYKIYSTDKLKTLLDQSRGEVYTKANSLLQSSLIVYERLSENEIKELITLNREDSSFIIPEITDDVFEIVRNIVFENVGMKNLTTASS